MRGESYETRENPKEAAWRKVEAEVEKIVDKLGKPVDPGIKESVLALRVSGLSTDGSCEGHLNKPLKAPWIDIGYVPREVSDRVERGWRAGGKFSEEDIRMIVKTRNKLLAERKQLIQLLNQFYSGRNVPSDRRLVIEVFGNTTRLLPSQGAKLQETLPPEVRQEMLREFQDEMNAFTQFLKERFFSEK